MKRRDWKTKKSIKITYDKPFFFFLKKNKRLNFLRKLFLRKNLKLDKKNLVTNFYFFNSFLKNLKLKKLVSIKVLFLNYLTTKINYYITPNFIFKKFIFKFFNEFKKFLSDNKLNYFFLNNLKFDNFSNLNKLNFFRGVNAILFSAELKEPKYLHKLNNIIEVNDKKLITFKFNNFNFFLNFNYALNYFFNYHIFNLLILEFYKIIIYTYILNFWSK